MPLFDLVRYLVTFSGAASLVYAVAADEPISTVIIIVSTMLALYGATDFANGGSTLISGVDRTFRKVNRENTAAVSLGLGRLIFGFLTVWLAVTGFLIS